MATICQKHGPSPRRSARGARSADSGRFGFNLGGLTRYPRDPRSRYAVFGPLITCDIVDPGPENVIPLQLCGVIIATAAPASWCNSCSYLTLEHRAGGFGEGAALRYFPPAGVGSGRIGGSLVDLVVDRWVSGHRINENGPRTSNLEPIGFSQGPRGGGGQV